MATWLRSLGIGKGDRVILMLGNQVELWESMLAVAKLGAIIMPTTGALGPADLADRISRGGARFVIANGADAEKFRSGTRRRGDYRIAVGPSWSSAWRIAASPMTSAAATPTPLHTRTSTSAEGPFEPGTAVDDSLLVYFTSGTTSGPSSWSTPRSAIPVGHLSTMAWIGGRPGDVHLAISSPGWAKHAWSCFFAPWIAEATIFVYNYSRFDAAALLAQMRRAGVTTFCAPPTVWRMLIQTDLGERPRRCARVLGAGEPLNPEVIAAVQRAWGLTHPRRLRADRDQPADRQHTWPAGEGRIDGPADAGRAGGAGRPADRRARRRGRDLPGPVQAAAEPDDRVSR